VARAEHDINKRDSDLAGRPAMNTELNHRGSAAEDTASIAAVVSASPQRLREACLAWAKTLRWQEVQGYEADLVLRYSGHVWRGSDMHVAVYMREDDRSTEVTFSAFAGRIASLADRRRLAGSFARMVCSDLVAGGTEVVPAELGLRRQKRAWAGWIAKWHTVIDWILVGAGLAVLGILVVLPYVSGRETYEPAYPGAVFFFSLPPVIELARLRTVGVRAWSRRVLHGLLSLGMVALVVDLAVGG
jgi:hypothetical protein